MHDERTLKDWIEDQGLEYVSKKQIVTQSEWLPKNAYPPKLQHDVNVGKSCIAFSLNAYKRLGTDRILVGIGKLNGDVVLLIRPSGEGYKINTSDGARLTNSRLMERLRKKGLPQGKYRMLNSKSDFVAVKVE